jgi:hypothetical protein
MHGIKAAIHSISRSGVMPSCCLEQSFKATAEIGKHHSMATIPGQKLARAIMISSMGLSSTWLHSNVSAKHTPFAITI